MKWKHVACNPCFQHFVPGTKPALVETAAAAAAAAPAAAAAAAAPAAAGPGSRLLLTDPPLQLRLLPEVAQLGHLPRPEAA